MEEDRSEIERLLEERLRVDEALQAKFTKPVAVMFTDIKGSTAVYDTHGDIDGRVMVHRHNEIVLPIITENGGTLLKTVGDGTMSAYEVPGDAARAAVSIQRALSAYNRGRDERGQIRVRVGISYGTGIVEKSDIYGDVVNVASRLEALAGADEIMVTEDLYKAVREHDEFIFRYVDAVPVKGKREPVRVYRLLWQPVEISLGKTRRAADVRGEREGVFVLEAWVSGQKMKISGSERTDGEERAAKSYEEIRFNDQKVKGYTREITELLNRANRRGKIGSDLLIKLKEIGRLFYDELIPVRIKELLTKTRCRHLIISIDDKLVHIPWELLCDGKDLLCRRFAMGRTVTTKQRVSALIRAVGTPLKMLVLADPRGDLAASYEEGVDIKDEIGPNDHVDIALKTTDITVDFVKAKVRNFDIVHYAGHAEHDAGRPAESGWLLRDGRMEAGQIMTMTGVMPMPSLVFSNACQTAPTDEWRLDEAYEDRIFGLANAFLLAGVQHYIGTFWEIPDQAGAHFAVSLYKSLITGASIGEAVQVARQALISKYGEETIVWASYVMYGDPTSRYINRTGTVREEREEQKIEKEELVSSELRHGAGRIAVSGTKPFPVKLVAAAAMLLLIGFGIYSLGQRGGSGKPDKNAVVTSAQPSVPADTGRRIDELVAGLARDYRANNFEGKKSRDDGWTTPPVTMVFMDVRDSGVPGTSGTDRFLDLLTQTLQNGGRVNIVERALLARLLEELKLSASSLTDPATALKIGKILSARVMATGTVFREKGATTAMLRLIDTETTAVRKVISAEVQEGQAEMRLAQELARQIAEFVKADFPIRGRVIDLAGDRCRLNLGSAHGLRKGDRLELLAEVPGKKGLFEATGMAEVSEVDKHTAWAVVTEGKDHPQKGTRVRAKEGHGA